MIVVSVDSKNSGILSLVFPGVPVYKDYLPPFQFGKVIIFSEKIINPGKGQDVIQVKRSGGIKLDSKEGFFEYINSKMPLNEKQKNAVLDLEDEEFWYIAKLIMMGSKRAIKYAEDKGSIFLLFKELFTRFDRTYELYKQCKTHHEVVASSLITMMSKTEMLDAPGISPGYRKTLANNAPYMSLFKKSIMTYVTSKRQEVDFLSFLLGCTDKRG